MYGQKQYLLRPKKVEIHSCSDICAENTHLLNCSTLQRYLPTAKIKYMEGIREISWLQVVTAPSCTVIKILTIFFHPINQDSFLVF